MNDSLLATVLVVLLAFTALTIWSMLGAVMMQTLASHIGSYRREKLEARWYPVMDDWMSAEEVAVPRIWPGQLTNLMRLWLRTVSYVEGEAAEGMGRLAEKVSLGSHARTMLASRSAGRQVVALAVLGATRDPSAWSEIRELAAGRRADVALSALEALIRIDPERAAPAVIRALHARRYADPVRVGRMIRELSEHAVAPLLEVLAETPPGGGKRLIDWLTIAGDPIVMPRLRERLALGPGLEESISIIGAMSTLGDAQDREIAVGLLAHPDWRIRMKAVQVLGSIGMRKDGGRIEAMLSDPAWWVRYATAKALHLAYHDWPDRLEKLAHSHPDLYARQVLQRVNLERRR